ncbi:unnamed protein product, partial [Hymenolepis diminuta]
MVRLLGVGSLILCAYLICSADSIEVNKISAIRFAQGTGVFPQGRDGVLEVKYEGSWSSICNFGFDHVAASTACYMLGFPPYGFTIYNTNHFSNISARLSHFN